MRTSGPDVGDAQIRSLGRQLAEALPQEHAAHRVGRVGGTTFAVVLESATESRTLAIARHLQERLEAASAPGQPPLDVSIGYVLDSRAGQRSGASDLIASARRAADEARATRRRVGPSTQPSREFGRGVRLAGELVEAIHAGRLYLGYQPIVRLSDDHILGVEGLIRWDHKEHGLLRPQDFLDFIAARWSGLAVKLTEFALESALQLAEDCRDWALPVSVNVTSWDLGDSGFPQRVRNGLERHGIPPSRLSIEILETDALHPEASRTIASIRDLGVRLAIDDVGVGLSNLDRIIEIPDAALKIDRFLVTSLPTSAAILQNILDIARRSSPSRRVVAEGINDDRRRREVVALGYEVGQGFCWGEPDMVRAADVLTHLRTDWKRDPSDV